MLIYEIEELFPGIPLTEDLTGGRIMFTQDSFNVIIGLPYPSPIEIDSLYDQISYGLYINGVLPFFCISTHEFSLAFSMNFLKVNEKYQKNWIDAETKDICVFLVDSNTHILKAFRNIHLPWMQVLREVLSHQRDFDKDEIDQKIRRLECNMSVREMVNQCSIRFMALPLE